MTHPNSEPRDFRSTVAIAQVKAIHEWIGETKNVALTCNELNADEIRNLLLVANQIEEILHKTRIEHSRLMDSQIRTGV